MVRILREFWVASALLALCFGSVAQAVEMQPQGVKVDESLFSGKQVLVLMNGSGTSHKEIKNQENKQDHWILQSPRVVQIGFNSYLKGRAVNGPINFKGKVVWIELSKIQIMREN